jgi:hypothetical protein
MTDNKPSEKPGEEFTVFEGLWENGYFEGDPLNPYGNSRYFGPMRYMSVLHVTYLTCIKPYVAEDTIALEIGPGRGAWTRALLGAKEVWCLDAVSAQDNRFWEYVGRNEKVRYFKVSDFSCSILPDNAFDYLFSFGVFCHLPFARIREYMENLHGKLKTGAHCFIMVADYEKYNAAFDKLPNMEKVPRLDTNEDQVMRPGRWFHAGCKRTCDMLTEIGYRIVDPDVGALHRDPIIHFQKP